MNFHDPDAETAGAILTIDLGALADNWRLLAAKHANNQCAAVVKADAYGVGVRPAGKALHAAGCRIFFVAHPTEGVRLRKVLPDVEIHVLNGFCAPATVYLDHDLISSGVLDQIRAWADSAKARGGAARRHSRGYGHETSGSAARRALAADRPRGLSGQNI